MCWAGINRCPILTLEHIPASLPKLKSFIVTDNPLRNLRHFPKDVPNLEQLNLEGNQLVSLEGFPHELPKIKYLILENNSLTSLKYLPKITNRNSIIELKNNPLRSLCYLSHDNTFTHLITSYYDRGFDLSPRIEALIDEAGVFEKGEYFNMEVIDQVQNYYRKPTSELIRQYISDPELINQDELERIIWEANIEDRNAFESNFPADNVVIQKINKRLRIILPSGNSIFK